MVLGVISSWVVIVVSSGLAEARGSGLGVATVLVVTPSWVVVAGSDVVGLVVTSGQYVSLEIPVLKQQHISGKYSGIMNQPWDSLLVGSK